MKNSKIVYMERTLTNFLKDLLVGLIFWALIALAWVAKADDLPEIPKGSTVKTPSGLKECYPTEEFRKIVIWVEIAKHFHYMNHELDSLLETTREELSVVNQQLDIRNNQFKASQLEMDRLKIIIDEQQKEQARNERIKKIKSGLAWGGIVLLAAGTATFGLMWGVSK